MWNLKRFVDPTLKSAAQSMRKRITPTQAHPTKPLQFVQSLLLPNRQPYSFTGHEDLIQIAQDTAQLLIIRKAAQKGVTELMLRIQLYLASQNYSTAYFLRSRYYMNIQVQRRVEPLIAANKTLQKALLNTPPEHEHEEEDTKIPRKYRLTDNIAIKRLWGGWCLYMGLQSEADVRSFPLDAIFIDEVETLKPNLTIALQERLYHSTLKWQRWFSQPTAIGYGIDERFQQTDQRHMLFTCQTCQHEFTLEESFPNCLLAVDNNQRHILLSEAVPSPPLTAWAQLQWTYACPRCHKPFHPLNAPWRWVAKFPSRPEHGYHLTQLYSPTMTPNDIAHFYLRAHNSPTELERFHNSILGLPYAGGDKQPITRDKLRFGSHSLTIQNEYTPRYAGIDVGDTLHLIALEPPYIIAIEQFTGPSKWAQLSQRLLALKVKAVAINAMPYKDSAKELIRHLKTHNIEGALIYDTSDDAKPSTSYEDEEFGSPIRRITMPRTELMDSTVNALTRGDIILPPPHLEPTQKLIKHLQNYIIERDEQGNRRYARGREDHLGRALDYALLIARTALHLQLITPNYGSPSHWLVQDSHTPFQPL
jgi:rubredoxin